MNTSSKRLLTPDIDHRSTKRRKAEDDEDPLAYSTRDISWEEQKKLPKRFHEHGEGFWPALRIVEERGYGRKREYLIEWEPHPRTAEIFAPTWTPVANVNTPLRKEWEHKKLAAIDRSDSLDSSPLSATPADKIRPRNRRIISDSFDEIQESSSQKISTTSKTSTATGSPTSVHSSYSIEIAETQEPIQSYAESLDIPPGSSIQSQQDLRRNVRPVRNHTQQGTLLQRNSPKLNISAPTLAQARTSPLSTALRQGFQTIHTAEPILQEGSSTKSPLPARILEYNSQAYDPPIPKRLTQGNSSSEGYEIVHESSPHSSRAPQPSLSGAFALQSSAQQPLQGPLGTAGQVLHSPTSQPSLATLYPFEDHINSSSPYRVSKGRSTSDRGADKRTTSNMAARNTRQSPRLQVAVPHLPVTSPRVPLRTGNTRTRPGVTAPEISSPLATTAFGYPNETLSEFDETMPGNTNDSQIASIDFQDQTLDTVHPSSMHNEPAMVEDTTTSQSSADAITYDTITMPIQASIEEEMGSSNEDGSLESKASSSQQSLDKEQLVRQQGGLIMPEFPIIGPDEYCLALPAEGKIQAIYSQTIKVKRKAILRFIRRRGSVNSSGTSATKTIERNDMLELIQRLHDTTSHIDLGLPGIPTQYTIPSREHAAYAEYAGSKFVFLGCLVDDLMRRDCTLAIMAQPATQDLLEEYLLMKHVKVVRHDRPSRVSDDSQSQTSAVKVQLLSTKANDLVDLVERPVLVIAFDASFESLNPQLKHMRAQFPGAIPVLHLMVTNSSEHVERCLPASMPSPIRLKLLVRATYQAHANLGGPTTYVEDPSDIPVGRPMDMLEYSKAIKKSPKRKIAMMAAIAASSALSNNFAANWTLRTMPELVLDELIETPPSSKDSRANSMARRARSQTPATQTIADIRGRSRTPISVAGTPNNRKRLLDSDTANNLPKKPRMDFSFEHSQAELNVLQARNEEIERELDALRTELAAEKRARQAAEAAHVAAEQRQREWQLSLAELQRRYEKRTKKSHQMGKDNKKLINTLENHKQRVERLNIDNASLKSQLAETRASLATARDELKSAGGDISALELAREEARNVMQKAVVIEKSLENTKRDFEFVRNQYQDASSRAVELASQVTELEKKNVVLEKQASDEKRRLKELSLTSSSAQHLAKIAQLEQELRHCDILLKRKDEETKMLKRNRGVQTRGSSVQPGSPGPRSRQASPAAGLLAPPSGSRASALRNER